MLRFKGFILILFFMLKIFSISAIDSSFIVRQQSRQFIDIEFTLTDDYEFKLTRIDGKDYTSVYHPEAQLLMHEGLPELPFFSTLIAVPENGKVSVEILDSSNIKTIDSILFYPSQGFEQSANAETGFVVDNDFYLKDKVFPDNSVLMSDPAILRDLRLVSINLFPFSYNPAKRELTITKNLALRIGTDFSETGINELTSPPNRISRSFERIYRNSVLNYDQARTSSNLYQDPSLLVLHHHSPDIAASVDYFVSWKRQKGFYVNAIATTPGDDIFDVKDIIQNAYDNWPNPPEYVVLIGGGTGDYSIPLNTIYQEKGDTFYSLLSGDDILPDLAISRISVNNNTDFETFLNKLNNYEISPFMDETDWYRNALLVGDPGWGVMNVAANKYIKEMMLEYNEDYMITEVYSSPFPSQMNSAINNGTMLFNYGGSIGMSAWIPANQLENGYMLSNSTFFCDVSLNYSGTSLTELFVRFGSPTEAKGGISSIGMTGSGEYTVIRSLLAGGIYSGIFDCGIRTMGEALVNGKLHVWMNYGVLHPDAASNAIHWANMIGDSSMQIWIDVPKEMNADFEDSLAIGSNHIDVVITDEDDQPVENARVTANKSIDNNEVLFASGYTDARGEVTLFFDSGITGEVLLTVTKPDYEPVLESFQLAGDSSVALEEIILNNGFEAGNDAQISAVLKNHQDVSVYGVSAELSSADPYVTIIQNEASFGEIPAGMTATSNDVFTLSLDTNTPDMLPILFTVTVTDDDDNIWISKFSLTATGYNLAPLELIFAGNDNGFLDPGESALMQIAVQNQGSSNLQDVYAVLRTNNPKLSIVDSLAYIGDVGIDEIVTSSITNSFFIHAYDILIPGMLIGIELNFYNNNGFEQNAYLNLEIGEITVNDPLGPCAYGYYMYGMEDTGYEFAPAYDWIEIAPSEGGSGTDTGLQSDWNHIQGIYETDLPFTFTFYGVDYDQVNISANGWISFGSTENAMHMNYRLPGPLAPKPVVAAFWDNLSLAAGGVYTFYDQDQDIFIIQWQNALNAFESYPETFQIILYNPELDYNLNDGVIKIQYKTFNNVNSSPLWSLYATIGIQDHTGTIGLEYTFGNQYPTATAPLGDDTAIMIVGPMSSYHPLLVLHDLLIFDENNSGFIDAGENIGLGIYLKNLSYTTADEVTASISTTSNYISITNPESGYYDIPSGDIAVNREFLDFYVSESTPDGYTASFTLHVDSDLYSANIPFSLNISKPEVLLTEYRLFETDGDGDGILDPGETANLALSFENPTNSDVLDAIVNLTSTNDWILIENTEANIGTIPANSNLQAAFTVSIDEDCPEGSILPLTMLLTANNISTLSKNIKIGIAVEDFTLDFEDDDAGFVSNSADGWQWGEPAGGAYAGNNAWATVLDANYVDDANWTLDTTEYLITPATMLSFYHRYNIEHYWDGGNLKISTDQGQNWQLIIPFEGYPVSSSNSENSGIPGQPAYSGNSNGWEEASFDLSGYFGQTAMIRWHFGSGQSINAPGWFIDAVSLTGTNPVYGLIAGNITLQQSPNAVTNVLITAGAYSTKPDSNGDYLLIVPEGSYSVSAEMPFHVDDSFIDITVNNLETVSEIDFSLFYLTPPDNLNFTYEETTHEVHLSWDYYPLPDYRAQTRNIGSRDDEPLFLIYRQQDSGGFEVIASTELDVMEYTDFLTIPESVYRYYIVALYPDGESDRTNQVTIDQTLSVHDLTPVTFALKPNYPNPFNPVTNIGFTLPQAERVTLKIYNIKGALVKTVVDDYLQAGDHLVQWQGVNNNNRPVGSGVYFYRIEAGNNTEVRKALLLK